jgi:hypothetical protein
MRRLVTFAVATFALLVLAAPAGAWWTPPKRLPWYWQLSGTLRMDRPVSVYDIDGFDHPATVVSNLHGRGVKVIAYFSAGSFENWRPDASSFPAAVKGRQLDGWAGERWLDIRRLDILRPIMRRRAELARAKGFDAIEWDNVEGYTNGTGFPLTGSHQIAYNRMLAEEAHRAGLAVFLKNDVDQVRALQPYFDGAINEQCAQYSECGVYGAFLAAGKPVLAAEYQWRSSWCTQANQAGRMLAVFNLSLNGRTFQPCW